MSKNKVFIVIDGNSVAHRAFHAMPPLTNKKGQAVGAVHGFLLAFLRAVEDFRPDYAAVCFDTKGGTFRNREFKDYKAQRPATPTDLVAQLKAIQELLPRLGVAVFAKEGFEADDLIASVIRGAKNEQGQSAETDFFILTGDHDSLQLVGDRTKVLMINRGIKNAVLYDKAKVKEISGVAPGQIPALKALAGDSSDNIPGAPGIGPKAAAEILEKCGNLEKALADARAGKEVCFGNGARQEKTRNILLENEGKITTFERLATMMDGAETGEVLPQCKFNGFDEAAGKILLESGLASLAKRMPGHAATRNRTLF